MTGLKILNQSLSIFQKQVEPSFSSKEEIIKTILEQRL